MTTQQTMTTQQKLGNALAAAQKAHQENIAKIIASQLSKSSGGGSSSVKNQIQGIQPTQSVMYEPQPTTQTTAQKLTQPLNPIEQAKQQQTTPIRSSSGGSSRSTIASPAISSALTQTATISPKVNEIVNPQPQPIRSLAGRDYVRYVAPQDTITQYIDEQGRVIRQETQRDYIKVEQDIYGPLKRYGVTPDNRVGSPFTPQPSSSIMFDDYKKRQQAGARAANVPNLLTEYSQMAQEKEYQRSLMPVLSQSSYQKSIIGKTSGFLYQRSRNFGQLSGLAEFGISSGEKAALTVGQFIPSGGLLTGQESFWSRTVKESQGLPPLQLSKDIYGSVSLLRERRRDDPRGWAQAAVAPTGIASEFGAAVILGIPAGAAVSGLRPSRYIRPTSKPRSQTMRYETVTIDDFITRGRVDVRQNIPRSTPRTASILSYTETPANWLQRLRGNRIATQFMQESTGRNVLTRQIGTATDTFIWQEGSSRATFVRQRGSSTTTTRNVPAPIFDDLPLNIIENPATQTTRTTARVSAPTPITSRLMRRTTTAREFSLYGQQKGWFTEQTYSSNFVTATTSQFTARSFPTQVRRVETFFATAGGKQVPFGSQTTQVGFVQSQLRISKTGEVFRENLQTRSRGSTSDRLMQDVFFTPDPAQRTTTMSGFTALISYKKRARIIPKRETLGYLVPKGKRATFGGNQRTIQIELQKPIVQQVNIPKVAQPTIKVTLKIAKAPKQVGRVRSRATIVPLARTLTKPTQRFFATQRPAQALRPTQATRPSFINIQRSAIVSQYKPAYIQQTSQVTQLYSVSPISQRINTPNIRIGVPVPPVFSPPILPDVRFGGAGTPFYSQTNRSTRRGYTRSLAGVGAKGQRRRASLLDIRSGLTVRF